jgi:hypothetical protein
MFTGDDLGANLYLAHNLRLEFANIPFLRDANARAVIYMDNSFYPMAGLKEETWMQMIKKSTRTSYGMGVGIPIGENLSVGLLFNLASFNAQKGDFERYGLTLSLNIF